MPLQLLFSNWLWKKNSFPWPLRKEDRTCLHGPRLSKPTGGDGATHKCPSQAAWWRGITISLVILFTQGASFAWTGFDSLIFPTDCMSYLKKKKKISVFKLLLPLHLFLFKDVNFYSKGMDKKYSQAFLRFYNWTHFTGFCISFLGRLGQNAADWVAWAMEIHFLMAMEAGGVKSRGYQDSPFPAHIREIHLHFCIQQQLVVFIFVMDVIVCTYHGICPSYHQWVSGWFSIRETMHNVNLNT